MTDPRPAPYPADTRAKGWRFELDYEKIDQSDTWDIAAEIPMAQHALLFMWLTAWRQQPCGSFPNDEAAIRAKCRIPPSVWAKCRDVCMRGWWLADDGRLYHDTITERVLQMLDTRGTDRARQDARRNLFEQIRERDGRACVYCGHGKYLTLDHLLPVSRGGDNDERNLAIACRPCNSKKRDRTPEEAGMQFLHRSSLDRWESYKESAGEKRTHADSGGATQRNATGTGTGTSTYTEANASVGAAPKAPRASRKCPEGYEPPDAQQWAEANCPGVDWRRETEKFRDHTFKTALTDWRGAWRNWMRRAAESTARRAPVIPINRQEAIEQRNREVGDRWLAEQKDFHAAE